LNKKNYPRYIIKMFKNSRSILTFALIAILVLCVCGGMATSSKSCSQCNKSYMMGDKKPTQKHAMGYGVVSGVDMDDLDDQYAPASHMGTGIDLNVGCAMNAGVGLASSLLPREMASKEDFGQFAPDDILKGQNFLDPRNQIGFPETIGGNLRNANQQIRADPPNPKQPYVWNNSTIVPDLMQRKICT